MLTEAMLAFELSPVWTMVLILALVFLLGWPLEWVPIVLIIVPIILPVVEQLDFGLEGDDHLIWFAILVRSACKPLGCHRPWRFPRTS